MFAPDPKVHHIPFDLKDGTRIVLRPVVAEDLQRLREGLKLLSDTSIHSRFNSGLRSLSEPTLRHLSSVDQSNHVAWGALLPSLPEFPGVGIVHMVKIPGRPGVAELAVTVIDEFHHRGVGTVLAALMYLLAPRHGLHTLTAVLVPSNEHYAQVLTRLGAVSRFLDHQYELDWPVLTDWDRLPDTEEARTFRELLCQLSEKLSEAEAMEQKK